MCIFFACGCERFIDLFVVAENRPNPEMDVMTQLPMMSYNHNNAFMMNQEGGISEEEMFAGTTSTRPISNGNRSLSSLCSTRARSGECVTIT